MNENILTDCWIDIEFEVLFPVSRIVTVLSAVAGIRHHV